MPIENILKIEEQLRKFSPIDSERESSEFANYVFSIYQQTSRSLQPEVLELGISIGHEQGHKDISEAINGIPNYFERKTETRLESKKLGNTYAFGRHNSGAFF